MATPEAILLQRLAQSQEDDPDRPRPFFTNIMARRSRELHETEPFLAMDSLRIVMEELERQDPLAELESVFRERLGQLHELEPERYPSPDEVLIPQEGSRISMPFIARGEPGSSGERGSSEERRALSELWLATRADLNARHENRMDQIRGEILRETLKGYGLAVATAAGGLDEFIRERDPTAGAREAVQREVGEGASALRALLAAAGRRIGEGAAAAGDVLGQGATDLDFLIRQFIREEIVGSGGAEFPEGNPRAVAAERFAGRR